VGEFEKEYERDKREVRQQEKQEEKNDYWRGSFPGKFTAKTLFGWSNRRYDQECWSCMDRNWRKWKGTRPLERRKLNTITEEEREDEYQGERIEEWDGEDEIGQIGNIMDEL